MNKIVRILVALAGTIFVVTAVFRLLAWLLHDAALLYGDYKIVFNRVPVGDNQWHWNNIVTDPGEAVDLSGLEPVLLQQMLGLYQWYTQDSAVLPLPAGFDHNIQVVFNGLHDRFGPQFLTLILAFLLLVPFYVACRINKND